MVFFCILSRYICPDHVNPAEFLADLISVDYSSAESVYSTQKRINALVESFSQQITPLLYASPLTGQNLSNGRKLNKKMVSEKKGGLWRQFRLLLRRAWMQVILKIFVVF